MRQVWTASVTGATLLWSGAALADPATQVAEVVVVSLERLDRVAGAATVLSAEDYDRSQPFTVNDVLRRVPGLYLRGEEGLGLRPNIGFRGLNPTRSSEVLLLEDGVPLAYAPYGDNASYYHPPVERFSGVEVLKGSAQIAFGPHTVGGVINYTTPKPSEDFTGRLLTRVGGRDTREFVLQGGDTLAGTGLFGSLVARESGGSRANHNLSYRDVFLKARRDFGSNHTLAVKGSWYGEDSQVSYSGLTQGEYEADPRQNPFGNDSFQLAHYGLSASHGWRINEDLRLTTVLYGATFERDWWRQSSNSSQRPNDASDPACGGMANLDTTCGNEGRLRQYYSYGLDSRGEFEWKTEAFSGRLTGGVRLHAENQERFQWNGDRPNSRSPGTGVNAGPREQNVREARAGSAFMQNELFLGDLTLSGGLRYERIAFERSNKLTRQRGESELEELIPGAGIAWTPDANLTVFAGAHRGFSPPRVEDVVSNAGGSIELDAERSLNVEFGVRARPLKGAYVEAAAFQMDFENQIVPASVAGGVGATLTSAGATLHRGIEAAGRFSSKAAFGTAVDLYADATATWVGTAEYRGTRLSTVPGFTTVSVTGNRLPYAPEWTARGAIGFETASGLQGEVEAVHTGEMFGDDLNTVAPTPDGQRGRIRNALAWNLAASWRVPATNVKLLASVRNVFDETYIVDRARGVLPGEPRIGQVGVELAF
jgi:Fe(3+) dicitrate transport protein